MKKTICILLSLVLAAAGLVGLGMTSSAVYKVGDTFTYGSYPQTDVTKSLGSALDSLSGASSASYSTWTSYGYMKYKDVNYNGEKYRGVVILGIRQFSQRDNGYVTKENSAYWFKYEPLKWRVLDPSTGFLLCDSIIDSQPFYEGTVPANGIVNPGTVNRYYVTNYAKSYVRNWLIGSFYNTAFSATEQAKIQTTALVTESAFSSEFDATPTNDKVFLLSLEEATNSAYGFDEFLSTKDPNRQKNGTDYARCQGLWVRRDKVGEDTIIEGPSIWRLRTGYTHVFVCEVDYTGAVLEMDYLDKTNIGVCPAIKIGNLNAGITVNSIAIKTMPAKTVYGLGESFNQSGLTLTASYSDGSTDTITSGFTCTGFSSAAPGISTVTVNYLGKTATFNVTIRSSSSALTGIAIKSKPSKTVYTYRKDTNIDLAGLEIEATYSDGTKAPVDPSVCSIKGYSAKPAGEKTIIVEFDGQTAQFNVTVKYAWWQWLIRIFLLGFIWY